MKTRNILALVIFSTVALIVSVFAAPTKPSTVSLHKADTSGQDHVIPDPSAFGTVLFFVSKDCPYSNGESPEMARIAAAYQQRQFTIYFVYGNPGITVADAVQHAKEHYFVAPYIVDSNQVLVHATGATVTPEAVVISPKGDILYRGRIDNKYATIGVQRTEVTSHDLIDALEIIASGKKPKISFKQPVGCTIPGA